MKKQLILHEKKEDRRNGRLQKIAWEEHRPATWTRRQQLAANTYLDENYQHQPDRRVDLDTLQVLDDMREMAKTREVIGMAAVGLRPDGRVILIACGNAYDDNIRASGALVRLQTLLSEINDEL